MFRKDTWYAAVVGLITALFATPILRYSETPIAIGAFTLPLWALFVVLPIAEFIGYWVASKLFSHILVLRQLGRFGIVGLMNFCVDTGTVYALREWTGVALDDERILYLFIVGASIAIVNSYFWQRAWTFSEKDPPTRKEFFVFVIITVGGIVVNTVVSYLVIQAFLPLNIIPERRLLALAKVIATGISLFWNFFGYKFFVFK